MNMNTSLFNKYIFLGVMSSQQWSPGNVSTGTFLSSSDFDVICWLISIQSPLLKKRILESFSSTRVKKSAPDPSVDGVKSITQGRPYFTNNCLNIIAYQKP